MKQMILVLGFVFLLGACTSSKPEYTYMPDMAYGPAMKAQKMGAMRVPPKGALAEGQSPYLYPKDPEMAAKMLVNPLEPTAAVLARGQKMFNTFCIVCHGPTGNGNGLIIPKFPMPPPLHSDRAKAFADGRIFHNITVGQNIMPSYASQIPVMDRWAIVHYVRVIQGKRVPAPPQINPVIAPPAPVVAPSPSPSPLAK